jgi:alanyl-tRNA synthetase
VDSRTIRDRFFAFFGERDHQRVPSHSLVANDPTLLLTNAGMNQFKPYFLGEQTPPWKRAMSVQKCFRTPDIDEVGTTARHLTFFEMLGNFSFGDYYKEKACPWAWDLVTEGWGIEVDRLWVTVYETDDEAAEIWTDAVGVSPERIIRRSKKDNFWSMGVAGPCGPCSEIFVDRGDDFGAASVNGPADNEERYVEVWNLVFMQNECNAQIEPVSDLPRRNIDTGAGVERLATILQGVASIYETDTLGGMVEKAASLTGKSYGADRDVDRGLRILADHGRGVTFLIADGVLPSNEKRGYVLRRIMRRAISHARRLGREEPALAELASECIRLMGDAYPEIVERKELILEAAAKEEERFDATLRQGMSVLTKELDLAKSASSSELTGDVAFTLHDTFGFPVDLTKEIAAEAGFEVDASRFEELMSEQRERARAARRSATAAGAVDLEAFGLTGAGPPTVEFLGYEHFVTPAQIVAMTDGTQGVKVATEGDEIDVILDRTVFYAEGGGQVGDRGVLEGTSGTARVNDTQRIAGGLIVHRATVTAGEVAVSDEVTARVDAAFRDGCQQAHTATHILHWTLRDRLGDHARQAGSLVEPGRLRFDFNHFDALNDDQLDDIGNEIQTKVFVDDAVRAYETSYDYATSIGAMAIFGEKYGDFVRVVEVGDYSKELCGGTHVVHTSRIGVVVVTGEGSVGANLRRVEALVGADGISFLQRRAAQLEEAAAMLKVAPEEVAERLERVLQTQKEMEKRLQEVEKSSEDAAAADLANSAVDVDGARLVVARRDIDVDALRSLAQKLKGRLGTSIVVLGAAATGRANLVGAVSKDLAAKGISARDLLAPGAALLGGGAGGKPELAISGGPSSDKIDDAIEAVAQAARTALTK